MLWFRANQVKNPPASRTCLWTECPVLAESFPSLWAESDAQRSCWSQHQMTGNVAKCLWCAKRKNNSAVQRKAEVLVTAVRAIVLLKLFCMNLVCIGSCNVLVFIAPEYLSFGSLASAPREASWMESGLFYYCKKEKHKMTEINVLTSETNKCSSCLHYPEVFDIPNYDITVGVIVAAVAFVKWSVMPHANK